MKQFLPIVHILSAVLLLNSCSDPIQEDINHSQPGGDKAVVDERAEAYVEKIDNAELTQGNSLYYTREDGASVEVFVYFDDSNKVIKTEEKYTVKKEGSICTNLFYYKDNKMYVSKEFFEDGEGESAVFVERVTYYDKKGKAKATKSRKAPFEDQLYNSMFLVDKTRACSDERAVKVLNQQGEYETNFQFFVNDQHLLYLVVGENKEDGYRSSLVVQQKGPVIQQLLANEKASVGKPLKVDFVRTIGEFGFVFQALMNVEFVK